MTMRHRVRQGGCDAQFAIRFCSGDWRKFRGFRTCRRNYREIGADGHEARWDEKLAKIAKAKPKPEKPD